MGILTFLRVAKLLAREDALHWLRQELDAFASLQEVRQAYPRVVFERGVRVQGWTKPRLLIENEVRLCSGTVVALGDELNGHGTLSIGERTWIGPYNNFRLGGSSAVQIGSRCLISQFCTIVSANHALDANVRVADVPVQAAERPVRIGDDVWLGASVVVLPGVHIGDGAVIGAGSVVTRDVPHMAIAVGNPARTLRTREV